MLRAMPLSVQLAACRAAVEAYCLLCSVSPPVSDTCIHSWVMCSLVDARVLLLTNCASYFQSPILEFQRRVVALSFSGRSDVPDCAHQVSSMLLMFICSREQGGIYHLHRLPQLRLNGRRRRGNRNGAAAAVSYNLQTESE